MHATHRRVPGLAGLLLALAVAGAGAQERSGAIRGDVDRDGAVSSADAELVRSHLVGRPLPEGISVLPAGDANGDGRITAVDAAVITRFLAGEDMSRFPVGKPEAVAPSAPALGAGAGGELFVLQECTVEVATGAMSCRAPAPQVPGGARLDIVVGSPYMTLASSGNVVSRVQPTNEDTTLLNVTLRNNLSQPIGTVDGTTAVGNRIFFHSGPTVTRVSSGVIGDASVRVDNPTGTADFANQFGSYSATNRPYFQYTERLVTNQTSASVPWRFVYDSRVTHFSYALYVAAKVQYEHGWITVTPASPVLAPGGTTSLSTQSFNHLGASVTETVTWSSSDTGVATVDGSGLVTAVAVGTATITATSTVEAQRTGTATVTVDAAPTVTGTTPAASATGVAAGSSITIDFSESVNAGASAFSLACPAGSARAFGTSSSPASTFVLTPGSSLPAATTCQVTVTGSQITDADSNDGPDQMAADHTFSFTTASSLTNDVYPETVIGNVPTNSADASPAFSVTANDAIAPGAAIEFAGWGATAGKSMEGGDVNMVASGATMGQFTYNPPPGFEGTDSIEYRVQGSVGKVSLTVSGMVWFIDGNAASPGDGRLSTPFNTLAAFQDVNGDGGNNPAAGDNVFVYEAASAYSGPFTLLDTQKLIGQDATATLSAITGLNPGSASADFPATNGGNATRAVLGGSAGLTVAQNNTLRGFSLEPTGGTALAGSSFGTLTASEVGIDAGGQAISLTTGTLNAAFTEVSSAGGTNNVLLSAVGTVGTAALGGASDVLTGATGDAFRITGGGGSFTYAGSVTNTASLAVNIASKTGGNVTLSGSINPAAAARGISVTSNTGGIISFSGASQRIAVSSANGVTLTGNTGAVVEFTGGALEVTTTTSGTGLSATGGGTVRVTGSNNTISSAGGIALDVQSTAIGTGGLTFRSIASSGGTHGIRLSATGTGGGLSVTGTGTAGSGGTISASSDAVTITTAATTHALENMSLTGGSGGSAGVFASAFGTLSLANSSITGAGKPALGLVNGTVSGTLPALATSGAVTGPGVSFTTVSGTLNVTSGNLGATSGSTVHVSGGALSLTYAGSASQATAGIPLVQVDGGHTGTLTFSGGTLSATNGTGLQFSNADGSYSFNGTTTLGGGDAGIDVTTGSAGTFSFGSGASITNPSGNLVNINGSAPTFTYSGSFAKSGTNVTGISIASNTGGTITFNGTGTKAINSGSAAAVAVTGNTGSSVVFSGNNLDIDTSSGTGILASGAGTLAISGTGNTINTTAGTALSLDGVTSGGLTFQRIDAAGGANGILLRNAGTGGLTVTGSSSGNCGGLANTNPGGAAPYGTRTAANAADCSGGTLGSTTGPDGTGAGSGVYLENSGTVSLTRVRITGTHSNFGLRGLGASNVTLSNVLMDGTFGNNAGFDEGAVAFQNLSGSASVTNSTFTGGVEHDFQVRNVSNVTLNRLTIDGVTFLLQTIGTADDHLLISNDGGGTLNASILNSRFMGARGNPIQVVNQNNSAGDLIVTSNVLNNEHGSQVSGGGGFNVANGGTTSDVAALTFSVASNRFRGANGAAVAFQNGVGVGTMTGTFSNNTVGEASVANSGSAIGNAFFLAQAQRGKTRIRIQDNSFHQYSGVSGIYLLAGGAASSGSTNNGSLHATLLRNTLSNPGSNNPGGFIDGLRFENGTNSGDQYTMCLNVGSGGANSLGSSFRTASSTSDPFYFNANVIGINTIFKLAGYPIATNAGTTADANIISTIRSLNGLGSGGYTEVPNSTTTYSTNSGLGVACDFN